MRSLDFGLFASGLRIGSGATIDAIVTVIIDSRAKELWPMTLWNQNFGEIEAFFFSAASKRGRETPDLESSKSQEPNYGKDPSTLKCVDGHERQRVFPARGRTKPN